MVIATLIIIVNVKYTKTDLKIIQEKVPITENSKMEYFSPKSITVNTRLNHAKSSKNFEELLTTQYQDSKNQFGAYLKAVQTARQNINTFEMREYKVKRFNSKLMRFQKDLPDLYKTNDNENLNQIIPFMSPKTQFLRTTASRGSKKSRNMLMNANFMTKPMSSQSSRRVISVYSSSSKRRSGSQVMQRFLLFIQTARTAIRPYIVKGPLKSILNSGKHD